MKVKVGTRIKVDFGQRSTYESMPDIPMKRALLYMYDTLQGREGVVSGVVSDSTVCTVTFSGIAKPVAMAVADFKVLEDTKGESLGDNYIIHRRKIDGDIAYANISSGLRSRVVTVKLSNVAYSNLWLALKEKGYTSSANILDTDTTLFIKDEQLHIYYKDEKIRVQGLQGER